ncbi:GNAT family N-acetyltransferase [Arsenicitalea aurantiaca]|uniref:GNAT family N-acetyltransferase n=1 Tax=Arsenicitalea aurantiaca TaxID=1783274 RepID=UPI001FCE8B5D|nr:GNAT family N-acetyltransferase [Arsenicitalea aurantiaca]
MSADPILRPFAWHDVPAISAIYAHHVVHGVATFDTEVPSEAMMAHKFGTMIDLGHPVIVAERDGVLVGYAYASTYRPRFAYRFTCEDSVYLAPDATRQGIGNLLLGKLIAESRAFGFNQMLAVITGGTAASIRLHEKHGFRTIGHYPELGFKFDRWHDIVHMQLGLREIRAEAAEG